MPVTAGALAILFFIFLSYRISSRTGTVVQKPIVLHPLVLANDGSAQLPTSQELYGEDAPHVKRLRVLVDNHEYEEALLSARKLASSSRKSVRLAVVESCRWIGAEAFPVIAGLLDDSDEEVREAATSVFLSVCGEISDPSTKAAQLAMIASKAKSDLAQRTITEAIGNMPVVFAKKAYEQIIQTCDGRAAGEYAREGLSMVSEN